MCNAKHPIAPNCQSAAALTRFFYRLSNRFFERREWPIEHTRHTSAERKERVECGDSAEYRALDDKNQLCKYWLLEEPEVLETSKNVVRYYPKHGKLVFHLPDYYSPRTCSMHIGKGVGLDLTALDDNSDVLHRLIEILQQIEKSA